MFCANCGAELTAQANTCEHCGGQLLPPKLDDLANPYVSPQVAQAASQTKSIGDDPAIRMLLPVGRSWLAIVAGYLGLLSILMCPAPLALLFGILAVVDIRKHPEKHGLGRAIFGIVMGGMLILGLFWLLGQWRLNAP